MSPRIVAVLDADVLVPIVACDFLLTAFDLGLFEPVVSAEVLAEVERTLIENFPQLDPAAIEHRVESMRVVLEDQTIDTSSVEGVPDRINAKDRHVVAAALAGEARVIVTNDGRLRSEIDASDLEIEARDANSFVHQLWQDAPAEVDAVIAELTAKRRRHPVTQAEMVEQLRLHFPSMVEAFG
ncbi:MAG: PIN domain-containing protein [Acidimicrobiales bacterium]